MTMATPTKKPTKQDGWEVMRLVDQETKTALGLLDLEAVRFDVDVHEVEGFMVLKIKIQPII